MFIVETGDQNVGWVGEKILDILFSCNTRTGFSDRNSGPKLCAVSIANDGTPLLCGRFYIYSGTSIGSDIIMTSDCMIFFFHRHY